MQGVVLDADSLDRGDIDFDALKATLPHWTVFGETPPAAVAERLADAAVVITNKVVLDRAAFETAPDLKLVCIAATGTDNVDLAAAREHGVVVCNVTGYATPAVVQHTFALLLGLVTHAGDFHRAVRGGRWSASPHFCLLDFPIHELAGRVFGIVGYGELGHAVGRVAECFGMTVQVAERRGRPPRSGRAAFDTVLEEADVVSLHAPLSDETRGLIGATELAAMKPGAVLINTARGALVDEAALADALRRGALAGAGIDVLSVEPPPADHPLLADDLPNLLLTPHVAWASVEARRRLMAELVRNIEAWRAGAPRNVVT